MLCRVSPGRNYRTGTPLASHWSITSGHQTTTFVPCQSLWGPLLRISQGYHGSVHKAGIHWWAGHPLNWHGCWQNSGPCSYKTTVVWSPYWLLFSTLVPQGWGGFERLWRVKKIGPNWVKSGTRHRAFKGCSPGLGSVSALYFLICHNVFPPPQAP